jgi:hypothetical protein
MGRNRPVRHLPSRPRRSWTGPISRADHTFRRFNQARCLAFLHQLAEPAISAVDLATEHPKVFETGGSPPLPPRAPSCRTTDLPAICVRCRNRMARWNQSRIGSPGMPASRRIRRSLGQPSVNAVSTVSFVRPPVEAATDQCFKISVGPSYGAEHLPAFWSRFGDPATARTTGTMS